MPVDGNGVGGASGSAAAGAGAGAGAGAATAGADVTVDKESIVLVGNSRLLRENGVDIPEAVLTQSIAYRRQGKITVYYTCGGVVRGIIALSDIIRPESAAVISVLQRRYNIACYMITGDDEVTAHAVAGQLGLSSFRVFASQKPEDKQAVIKKLQSLSKRGTKKSTDDSVAKNCVAFVGDGTNDSPALAQADVGFAMAGGTDIAVETGDMVLCKAELTALVVALDLSKATFRRIVLNYVWAFIYNIMLVPLAAGALYPTYRIALGPMLAGSAMSLSSVFMVLSSFSLSFYRAARVPLFL
jgi:P-type E1-E2 ATPase